jgi:hypothetical protein
MCKRTPLAARILAVRNKITRPAFHFRTPRRTGIFAVILTALLLCAANAAKATLLAYEGFNYPAGTPISGQSGGFGWAGTWATGSAGNLLGTNVAGGLSYTDLAGQSLMTTNGSLVVGNPAGPTATTATPNRTLSSTLAGGTYWISFLYQRLNFNLGTLPYLRQANLGLFASSGEKADIGGPNTSATVNNVFSAWGNGTTHNVNTPFQAPNCPISPGSTYFVLIKVVADSSTAADTSYVWINWTNLTVEPDISTASLTNNEVDLSSVNTLRFQAGNLNSTGSNAVFQVDELRIGTAFADVTPLATAILPPTITTQPLDQTVTTGDPATFTVGASGSFPFSYQWYFNTSTLLTDQTNATLNIASAQTNDAGGYFVVITNSAGSATSRVATLTVHAPLLPTISVQPVDVNIIAGNTVTFAVTAAGYAPLQYQWYFNMNTPLDGQTNASLTIPNVQTSNNGGYSVIITNSVGAITSRVATLDAVYVGPAGLPAFSGADGAAKYVTGGRGGIVYHVTVLDKNFNDSRPGTLRYGVTDANFPLGMPRTIVFDVAGVFWLGLYGAESNYDNGWNASSSRISFSTNITVAGQSAPGPVIIMGGNPHCSGTNAIVRNIMIAPGYGMQGFHVPPTPPTPGTFPDSFAFDAMDIEGQNVMLDHLTTVYATDEAISCNELANYLTIENCNVSQGQNYPQADAESSSLSYVGHALAHLLQAGTGAKISVLNDLYAHQKGRLPRVGSEVGTGPYNDFRNNVFYNWYDTAGTGSSGQPSFDNFINNYYLAGPGGDNPVGGANSNIVYKAGGVNIFNGSDTTLTRTYASGNQKDINKDGVPQFGTSADANYINLVAQSTAYDVNIGLTLSVPDAFTNVLRHVGSRWWTRPYNFILGNTNDITTNDIAAYVDERLIHETITGTGQIISWADDPFNDDPNEGVEWRELLALRADPVTGAAPFKRPANWDTDGDGMPDNWEIEHGLNPNVPDNNGDYDHSGYSNLEKYLNEIAAWPAPGVITFTGANNNRYAEIFNWQVNGVVVNIGGTDVATASKWLPSRYDTVLISNATVVVDAVGQNAGTLCLASNAVLNITNGWLKASSLTIGDGCTVVVQPAGTLRLTGSGSITLADGGTFTNAGTLDIMTWSGTLPAGFVNTGTVLDRSLIRVDSAAVDELDVQVTIQGYIGHNYQLQYCDSLSDGTWQNIGYPVAGANAPITLTHTDGATAQQRFYRVAVD